MRKGICVAGNMIVDILYRINHYPSEGTLTHIRDGIDRATGGAVCNVIVDLAKLDPDLPLQAMGKIGTDAEGDLVMKVLGEYPNIDTGNVLREGVSAFTIVMNDESTHQRTFFTYLGANGKFSEDDIDWSRVSADIFHIGYLLLLNDLDQPDAEYGSKMARLLHNAQAHGLKTSIDVVSEAGDRFTRLVPPAMRYTDYCVINEYEAEMTTGVKLRDDRGGLIRDHLPAALAKMKEMGVSTWAVIHCPEGGWGLDEAGRYVERASLQLPEGYIQGSTGAGDAFCAGVLYGAEVGLSLAEAIDLGIGSAAASLSKNGATEGMRSRAEVEALLKRFDRRQP